MSDEWYDFMNWLDAQIRYQDREARADFRLASMRDLCARLGNPQAGIKSYHVAGSKGKGSVSSMIGSILQTVGWKTGVYQSPHVADFRERIHLAEGFLPEEIYLEAAQRVRAVVNTTNIADIPGKMPWTWFELVTAYGMYCFRLAGVERVVYEVGMGGRLDATNVIVPSVSVINTIEREHSEILGKNIEDIARQKAGIMREKTPVLVAKQTASVRQVLREEAERVAAPILFVEEMGRAKVIKWQQKGMEIEIDSSLFSRTLRVKMKLLGEFQAQNALLAALSVKTGEPEINETVIKEGLEKAFLPGRVEIRRYVPKYLDIPLIIMDGAHTEASLTGLLEVLERQEIRDPELLFALAADKEMEKLARIIKGKFGRVTLTKPGDFKKTDLVRLEKALARVGERGEVVPDWREAIPQAFARAHQDKRPLVIAGSFYLVGEVQQWLAENGGVGES